jgi:hypothetical protein
MDVEHPGPFVDAVNRTFLDARTIEYVDAWLSNDVGHWSTFSVVDFVLDVPEF